MKSGSVLFTIVCECCGAKIEVDPKTRSVFSTEKKGMKKRSFEEVVEDVSSVGTRAQEKFKKGMEKQKNQKDELEKAFEKAKEKAKKDPKERPRSIFDYD